MDGSLDFGGLAANEDRGLHLFEADLAALRSIVVDLARIVVGLAPGALDRELATSRVRLQQIEAGRTPPAVEDEDLVLRHRIDTLELALSRVPTQA